MTLDGYALTGLFVVMFGFLTVSAYIAENWPRENPLNPDRRYQQMFQAHEETEE